MLLAALALAACAGESGNTPVTRNEDAANVDAGDREASAGPADGGEAARSDASAPDAGSQPDTAHHDPDPLDAPPRCTSGAFRARTEQEGPDMAPGKACIQCHIDSNTSSGDGDAPLFAFAGTVFPSGHEPDDCIASGALGAVVEITDANGGVHVVDVNESGNFFLEDPITPPFRAQVRVGDKTRKMFEKQVSGDCNGCHTATGASDAPGRITLP